MAQAPGIGGASCRVAGDGRHAGAGAVRSVGRWAHGREGNGASAARVSVTARLAGRTGACCRHDQAVLASGRVLRARGDTGARAGDGHGEDDGRTGRQADGQMGGQASSGLANAQAAAGRAGGDGGRAVGRQDGRTVGQGGRWDGHMLGLAGTAKRTVRVRVTGSARR